MGKLYVEISVYIYSWVIPCLQFQKQPPGVSSLMPFVISMCFLLLGRAGMSHRCSKNSCIFMVYIKGPFPTHLEHIWQPMEMSPLLGHRNLPTHRLPDVPKNVRRVQTCVSRFPGSQDPMCTCCGTLPRKKHKSQEK